jgi:hypothetical protein
MPGIAQVNGNKRQPDQTVNLNFETTVQNSAFGISGGVRVYGFETGLFLRNGGNNPKQWETDLYPWSILHLET